VLGGFRLAVDANARGRATNDRAPPSKKEKPWYQKATKIKSHLQSKLGLSPHKRQDGTSSTFKRDWLHSANPTGATADARMAQVHSSPSSAPIAHLATGWGDGGGLSEVTP
jgi:hypothetical protein